MKTDVLIAGAGPVGLTMASELTRYGLSVRLIDKNTERTDKSKALVLWARTLELMERIGTAPSASSMPASKFREPIFSRVVRKSPTLK